MKFTALALLAFVSGCASPSSSPAVVEHTQGRAPHEAPAEYREAVDALETEKPAEALEHFDHFNLQNPATPWSQAALLNSGRALEALKRWPEAIERYRQVVGTTSRAPRLQAMALYRLSVCHEALGDDPQVVADLRDLLPRKGFLPRELAEGELPARLAAAYARAGNFDKAQTYYQQAEVGITKLRQESKGTPEWLPRTLFLMGESSRHQASWSDFETALRPLARSQVYLLQAAELNAAPWSEKAADELVSVYENLFKTVNDAPLPAGSGDPLIARRALQEKQWERIGLINETLADLRARELPENAKVPEVKKLNDGLRAVDEKIAGLLEERPAGEGLTASAIARRRSRILKTESTNDSLEQQFLRSSREVKPALVPSAPAVDRSQMPTSTPAIRDSAPTGDAQPIRAMPGEHANDPNL